MRSPLGPLVGALATVVFATASTAAAQVRPTRPPPGQPPLPAVPVRVDTAGRRQLPPDSVPTTPAPARAPAPAARPTPLTQPPRPAGIDTVRPRPAARDTVARDALPRDTVPNPFGALSVAFDGRLETKLERTRNDRCASGVSALSLGCRAGFQFDGNFLFGIRSTGTVAEQVHVDLDYDTRREFDASNQITLRWESTRPRAALGRFEIGNVTFVPPASRFITGGMPSNNYGVQLGGRVGAVQWRAIAAQQRGTVIRDRVFTVGGDRASQTIERAVNDFEFEPRRFFWTIDPRRLPGFPNVDVLDRVSLERAARSLPDTVRPARLVVYRQLIGAAFQNPRGPKLTVRGAKNQTPQTYEVLREGIDYYVDQTLLWIALVNPLNVNSERLAVAYEVNVNGRRTRVEGTGGTPDLELTGATQLANLLWEPELAPGDSAFVREMRNVYRVGGEDLRRETIGVRIVTGIGDQEKPPDATLGATYLQLFGLAQRTSATTFDVPNRLWPRATDPNARIGGDGALGGKQLRDYFVIFPSQRPFARGGGFGGSGGGVVSAQNPANDTLYTFPSEFLYSSQQPPAIYRLRLRYESELGPEAATTIALGSLQLRQGSERITALGRTLIRDVEYTIDYELGTVTFLAPAALFPTPTPVSVKFEENPTFISQPTNVIGAAMEWPTRAGAVYFTGLYQARRSSSFTRPPLGLEAAAGTIAGVGADFSWNAPLLARLADRLTSRSRRGARQARVAGDTTGPPAARITLHGELAASKPNPGATQQAYLETFEGEGGVYLPLNEAGWYYGSRPAVTSALTRAVGSIFSLDRATTLAWQSTVSALGGSAPYFRTIQQIDPAIQLQGAGSTPSEPVFWLTLYPGSIGGLPASEGAVAGGSPRFRWQTGHPVVGRRWRSIRSVLNAGGADLSRVEDLEFYALVHDPRGAQRTRNPTLVFDFGELSENSVAFRPDTLRVVPRPGAPTGVDSLYSGRVLAGYDTLDTERDPLSRVFDAANGDRGLPGDRAAPLTVVSGGSVSRVDSLPLCRATLGGLRAIGDPTSDCTVLNGRLDEEDIDQDGELRFRDAELGNERFRRFVIDLSSPTVGRVTTCDTIPPTLGDAVRVPAGAPVSTAGVPRCWVHVRIPFRAPTDSSGTFNPRRVRAARLTVVSGVDEPTEAATTIALARVRLTGAPWLRRTDRVATGIAGDSSGTQSSYVVAGTIGTQDSTARRPYTPPPGTVQQGETVRTGLEQNRVQVNERSLRIVTGVPGGELARYERAEAYLRFPEGAKNVQTFRQLRVWARGNGNGWGDDGDLQFFVRIGRDENNFYLYRTPIRAGADRSAWLPEVRIDFDRFYRLRAALQEQLVPGRLAGPSRFACTGVDSALIARSNLPRNALARRTAACDGGYMVYTVDGLTTPPNLAAVQELAVGLVRVDEARRGATPIMPNDTLELWVDDVRLANAEGRAGLAGQLGVGVRLGDLADVRVNVTRRDPQFRQLGEAPSFVTAGGTEIGASLRLDRLLPWDLGLALPLTVTRTSLDASPYFIAGTDLRGTALNGLRAPREATTSYALSVRRASPTSGPLAPLVNNLSLTSTYVAGRARSAYQDGARHAFSLRADYDLAPGERLAFGGVRWTPTALRVTSGVARTDERQTAFLSPVRSPLDTGRVANGLDQVLQQGATLELRPIPSLSARWDASVVRDLRDYPTFTGVVGDTVARGVALAAARHSFGGVDLGFERQRVLAGDVRWNPALASWVRPRAAVATSYAMTRDPNAPSLVSGALDLPAYASPGAFGGGGSVTIPRRLGATNQLSAGATLDVARALTGGPVPTGPVPNGSTPADTSAARGPWLRRVVQPIDVAVTRTLTSSYDATSADAGLGAQLGLVGIGALRTLDGRAATLAGVVDRADLSNTLVLPYGLTLTNRVGVGTNRSWWRRAGTGAIAEGTGDVRVVPDLLARWNWRARGPSAMVSSVGLTAGMTRNWQTALAPADSLSPADQRSTLVQRWPLSGSLTWGALGGLTTSGGVSVQRRRDDLPGTRLTATSRDASAEAARAFRAPARWGLRSALRTNAGWQDSRTRTLVSGALVPLGLSLVGATSPAFATPLGATVQTDYGRRAVSFGANSDVAENLTFGLTAARVTTYNRNLGTQFTQTVLSAVLQMNFFAGERR